MSVGKCGQQLIPSRTTAQRSSRGTSAGYEWLANELGWERLKREREAVSVWVGLGANVLGFRSSQPVLPSEPNLLGKLALLKRQSRLALGLGSFLTLQPGKHGLLSIKCM